MTLTITDRGYGELRRDSPSRALEAFREALELEPGDTAAWIGTAMAAARLKIWSEVLRAMARVLELSSDRKDLVGAHLALGRVFERHDSDVEKSRHHYERALMLEPTLTWIYLALGELDLRTRRWSRATAHADHGLEFCAPEASERPLLLLVKAIASQRVSVSMSPMSTFFRGLRPDSAKAIDPAERAFHQAASAYPELRGLSYRDWLSDTEAAARFVREKVPAPARSPVATE